MTVDRQDAIATDFFEYSVGGQTHRTRVSVGAPRRAETEQGWCCPFLIEALHSEWKLAYGVGPIDALANAMSFIHAWYSRVKAAPQGGA